MCRSVPEILWRVYNSGMNKIVEEYQRNNKNAKSWQLHETPLVFATKEEFNNYLNSVDHPNKMGVFICAIGCTKYLLEIEPWFPGCLYANGFYSAYDVDNSTKDKLLEMIQKCYVETHKKRLQVVPEEIQFLSNLPLSPKLLEFECLGISYVLVKLNEQNS